MKPRHSRSDGSEAKILTEQNGDTLRIDTDVSGFHFLNRPKLRAELTLPSLREAVLSGAGSGTATGFTGDALRLVLDGAGKLDVEGHYQRIDARLSGAGKATLSASQKVNLSLSGASSVTVLGKPVRRNVNQSGVSKVVWE